MEVRVADEPIGRIGTMSTDGTTISTDSDQGIPRFCGKCDQFAVACPPIPQGIRRSTLHVPSL
jgi:hypothetical protein